MGSWTSIGPQPTSAGTIFVTSGSVNSIAIDPRNSKTIYVGSAEGGVWKTTNGGTTWKSLTDSQPSLANGAIALDPSNSEIVYVGTGEENFAIDSYYGAGILKSTNAGATWKNIVGPFLHAYIGGIAVSPSNNQVLLCASNIGIFRSTDGAETWTRVLDGIGTAVLFDPTERQYRLRSAREPAGGFQQWRLSFHRRRPDLREHSRHRFQRSSHHQCRKNLALHRAIRSDDSLCRGRRLRDRRPAGHLQDHRFGHALESYARSRHLRGIRTVLV